MSLPGLLAQPLSKLIGIAGPPASAQPSTFEAILGTFNTNLYFVGIMMLILNLAGRFIAMEITKEQEQFFQNPWVRRFLIFVVIFVATRNLLISFWLTIIVVLLIGYLFNENSAFWIIGKGGHVEQSKDPKPGMTPEEMDAYWESIPEWKRGALVVQNADGEVEEEVVATSNDDVDEQGNVSYHWRDEKDSFDVWM